MLKKDRAVCLRTVNYSETSQILTLFAKKAGKIDAIAKGSKRPKSKFDGPVEIFAIGDIVYSPARSAKLATLTEFQQQPVFMQLRTNLFAINCSLFAAELLNSLTHPYDPHPDLFDTFLQFLRDVQDSENDLNALTFLIVFQLTLLSLVGSKPVLRSCVNCKRPFDGKWSETYFSSLANGLICNDCEISFTDKIHLTKPTAACLTEMKLIAKAPQQTVNEVEKVLIYHFTELLHKPPKMAKYFLK
jgi:DNA repair protein RecO (recombination protein O)